MSTRFVWSKNDIEKELVVGDRYGNNAGFDGNDILTVYNTSEESKVVPSAGIVNINGNYISEAIINDAENSVTISLTGSYPGSTNVPRHRYFYIQSTNAIITQVR